MAVREVRDPQEGLDALRLLAAAGTDVSADVKFTARVPAPDGSGDQLLLGLWLPAERKRLARRTVPDEEIAALAELGIVERDSHGRPVRPALVEAFERRVGTGAVDRARVDELHRAGGPSYEELVACTGRRGMPGIRRALERATDADAEAIAELDGLVAYLEATGPTDRAPRQRDLRRALAEGYVRWGERRWARFADPDPRTMVAIAEALDRAPHRNLSLAAATAGLRTFMREQHGPDHGPPTKADVEAASRLRRTWSVPTWRRHLGAAPQELLPRLGELVGATSGVAMPREAAIAGLAEYAREHGGVVDQATVRAAAAAGASWPETRWYHEPDVERLHDVRALVDPEGARRAEARDRRDRMPRAEAAAALARFARGLGEPVSQAVVRHAARAGVSWSESRWLEEPDIRTVADIRRAAQSDARAMSPRRCASLSSTAAETPVFMIDGTSR